MNGALYRGPWDKDCADIMYTWTNTREPEHPSLFGLKH